MARSYKADRDVAQGVLSPSGSHGGARPAADQRRSGQPGNSAGGKATARRGVSVFPGNYVYGT